MTLNGTRFGDIDFSEDDIITFPEGIIGFPGQKTYLLLNHKPNTPFRWLQSLEEASLAFLVAFPELLVPEYAPEIDDTTANELGLTTDTPRLMLSTVTIPPGKPDEMTTNLLGPIIINGTTMIAKQVVLHDDAYTVKYRVFATTEKVTERVAA